MAQFDYEQNIWGRGEAGLSLASPTSFRLRQSLRVLNNLPAGAKVLEIGCGAGQFIRAVKKIKPSLDCFGCDISETAVAAASARNDGVEYRLSEPANLPYGHDFFDAILIYDVLEHAQEVSGLLRECQRVLKQNGVFYCFVPCEADWLSWWNFLEKVNIQKGLTKKYAGHINKFSRQSLLDILSAHGFSPMRVRYSEHFIGQAVGVISFMLMDRYSRKNNLSQINNEEYFKNIKIGPVKKAVNFLINLESALLAAVPSPNVHLVLKKK